MPVRPPQGRISRLSETIRIALALLLALTAARARAETDPRPAGFDGFDGFAFALHNQLMGYSTRTYMNDPISEEGIGGLGNAQWHYHRLEARVGLGGSYYIPTAYARGTQRGYGYNSYRRDGGLWLPELNLRLRLGAPGGSEGIRLGGFPLRSHKEPALFGDYLIRYNAYPGYLQRNSGDWDSLGSLAPVVMGLRVQTGAADTPVRTDFLLLRETGAGSMRDYSLLGFLSGTLLPGLDWTVGCEFYRAFSLGPRLVAPRSGSNGYVATDSGYVPLYVIERDTVAQSRQDTGYYTSAGTLFSIRAGMDLGKITGAGAGAFGGAGVFAEAALLGWKNQPLIYEDRLRRTVWTVGARLPAPGWLDVILVQAEWHPEAYHPSRQAVIAGWTETALPPERDRLPWSAGLLVSGSLGRHWALQARALYQERYTSNYFYGSSIFDDAVSGWGYDGSHGTSLQFRAMFLF